MSPCSKSSVKCEDGVKTDSSGTLPVRLGRSSNSERVSLPARISPFYQILCDKRILSWVPVYWCDKRYEHLTCQLHFITGGNQGRNGIRGHGGTLHTSSLLTGDQFAFFYHLCPLSQDGPTLVIRALPYQSLNKSRKYFTVLYTGQSFGGIF